MKHFSFAILLAFLGIMLGCKPRNISVVDEPKTKERKTLTAADSFTLSKTSCFGRCPVFECTLRGDGSASFVGKKFVDNVGNFTAKIHLDTVSNFVSALDAMGFDTMKNEYLSPIKDLPSVVISYKGKTVKGHLRELPEAFKSLVSRVDTVIAQTKWNSTVKE